MADALEAMTVAEAPPLDDHEGHFWIEPLALELHAVNLTLEGEIPRFGSQP